MLNFLTESAKDFQETETIGSFSMGSAKNDFDSIYSNAYNTMMEQSIDPKVDINLMIKNKAIMESFKDELLSELRNDCAKYEGVDGASRYASLYEQTSAMFDNCVDDMVMESTRVGQLLPIKAVDFPIIIKQNLALATKDIIQTEVTKQPIIKKHIERRWIVDEKTGKRWEYPQCFFKDDFKEIYAAGKGYPIKDTAVDVTSGLFNYNIPQNLTDATDPTREKITMDLKIVKCVATTDDGDVTIPLDMRINLSDSTWLGGTVKDPKTNEVIDIITGTVDFITNTVNIATVNKKVKTITFGGYLSNELNERQVTFDRTREEHEWKIEDGFRADVPYSLEELEDAKALMDIDLYKLTYNDLTDILIQMEDSQILEYLNDMFEKYDGAVLNPLDFNPFVTKRRFDCDSTIATVALPSEYIANQLKFEIDRFIIDIADTAKLEDVSFVIYGNPRWISLLDPKVNWVVRNGDMMGGVKLNYSYGVMTSGNTKVQVVSAMKIDAHTMNTIRIVPYPTNKDTITFKHYKYSTHIMTAQNSGYRSPDLPGGSATYLMGTSRYVNAHVQGIQGDLGFDNADFIKVEL